LLVFINLTKMQHQRKNKHLLLSFFSEKILTK
jgi:hypothetical protein